MGRPEVIRSSMRELLRLIRRLPEEKRGAALQEARTTIQQNLGESSEEKAIEYHRVMVSRIAFLRMTLPKRPGDKYGSGRFVVRGGELVEGAPEDFQGRRAADGTMDMECAVRKHKQLLKRQYFGANVSSGDVYGRGGF